MDEGAIAASVREARTQAGVGRDDITMLGLACQVDGLVALDDELRPLRPAIIWLDRRAGRPVRRARGRRRRAGAGGAAPG